MWSGRYQLPTPTLAYLLAQAVGCPAICRDEIKEGMAHSSPGFAPAPGDELTMRTLPVFFGVVELLLRAGVATIADAAFQDHVWRLRLEPFRGLAHLCIVHCVVTHEVAFRRVLQRSQDTLVRRAHADPGPGHDLADFARRDPEIRQQPGLAAVQPARTCRLSGRRVRPDVTARRSSEGLR
jgi:predicted kinase